MRLWPPLIIPPLVFLAALTAGLAVPNWECNHQYQYVLHVVALISLAVAAAGIALAWRDWHSVGLAQPDDEPDPAMQVRFLSALGLGISGLMALATITLWAVVAILPPCVR
jgi:hypothetical protein